MGDHRFQAAIDRRIAAHLRQEPSGKFGPMPCSEKLRDWVRRVVLPMIQEELGIRDQARKLAVLEQVIANLMHCDSEQMVVADSRNCTLPGVRLRVKIWDALVASGFVLKQTGSELSGLNTRYAAALQMRRAMRREGKPVEVIDTNLLRNSLSPKVPYGLAPVVLRNATKNPVPFPRRMGAALRARVEWIETEVNRINEHNLRCHSWVYYPLATDEDGEAVDELGTIPDQPSIRFQALYKRDFGHGGRLYSRGRRGYQSLTKRERRSMLIDGERIAELDYSGHYPRMLYHQKGQDIQGDVYRVPDVLPELFEQVADIERAGFDFDEVLGTVRKGLKKATNVLVNARSLKTATDWLKHYGNDAPHFKHWVRKYCGVSPRQLLERICEVHSNIADSFGSGVGTALQAEDGLLMLSILGRCTDAGVPALPLHDATICKASDAHFVRRAMLEVYKQRFGFEPAITREV